MLTVSNLGKSFKDKKIISDISFEVRKGEIMAILGPNGAGKSTTIRNIMGIMYPDEGMIQFHNVDSSEETGSKGNTASGKEIPRDKIGYLPEERGMYKNVKIMDILLYLAELKDYPLDKARKRALEYLAKFGLEGKDKATIEELSKGMGQKVQFIASIIHEPELLILDEPFSGLDPVSQEQFKEEIRNLAKQGTAILLSAHQMNLVEEMADRLFLIHRGQKVIYGKMSEVKRQYANFKCTIRGQNDRRLLEALPEVERVEQTDEISTIYLTKNVQPSYWLRNLPEELSIEELSLDRISLHEIFIDIATDRNLLMETGDDDA